MGAMCRGVRKPRVLIVEDDAAVRGRLRALVEEAGAEAVESASAEAALSAVAHGEWDLVLLDVHLPGMSGLAALPEFARARPGLPVVIVTNAPADPYAPRALVAGARSFVAKHRAAEELPAVIRGLPGPCDTDA
jgi:DNA-binding NarL/FixJ family response regulator